MATATTCFDPATSLTSALVALVRAKPVDDTDMHQAGFFALDAIANIAGGMASPDARPLIEWAASEPFDAPRRALVLGGASAVLEMDAMHRASAVHAGTVVVPALLALSHSYRIGGRAFLAALLRGSEAAFRIGRAAGPVHYKTFQNSATCGPFGAAMAAAEILHLSDAEAVHALGNAGTRTGGLWEFRETGAMSKQLHAGGAASTGIVCAQLAAHGFTGPLRILEGNRGFFAAFCPDARPDEVLREPNRGWGLAESSIKPWPSSRHTHPAIDAALALSGEARDRTITAIEIDTYGAAVQLCGNRSPATPHQAKSSAPFCAVAAIADGAVDLDTFTAGSFDRHRTLAKEVVMRASEPFASAYPESWGAKVTVVFADGTRLAAERRCAKGDPEAPLTGDELRKKAHTLLEYGGVEQPDTLISAILQMAEDGPVPSPMMA